MGIGSIGIVGAGAMGSGIAQLCAEAGYDTVVSDLSDELLNKGVSSIATALDRQVRRAAMSEEDRESVLARIKGTTAISDLAGCQLVIEAVVEDLDEKKGTFAALDAVCPSDTILASNTSSLPVIEMAMATGHPERVVGLHFFNPPLAMKLVELVRTIVSDDETVSVARDFAESLGKTVVLAKDTPGFVVNRLLVAYLLDAVRVLENGVATKEDIDQAMVLGCNMPMGPLALSDLVGLDVLLSIADAMFEESKEDRFAAPPLLRRMVTAGHLGRKTRAGFYDRRNRR